LEAFKSFISEAKDEKYKVVILTVEHGDKSITAKKLSKEATKLGLQNTIVNFNGATLRYDDGNHFIHGVDDEKGFQVNSSDTIIFVRGTPTKDSHLDLISEFERLGYCCVNNRTTINICADKYRNYVRLKDYGLTQPKTVLIPNKDMIDFSLESLDTRFPIIMKTLRGSKGVGVLFIESKRALDAIVQLVYKTEEDSDLLIQEYIKTDFDVRVIVLDGRIVATMQRDVVEGDFRSNYSQGGKVKSYKLTSMEEKECLLAAKAVDGIFTAVDFIPARNRERSPPYILEVNSSPGTDGIEEANNVNIAKEVLTHFLNPDVRYSVPSQCGYNEVVEIEPFGEMVAKFDTGNSVLSVLHADNIKVTGNKISFTNNGKPYTTTLVKEYEAQTGAGIDERYVVKLNLTFSGSTHEFMFGLDDRSKLGTDVLLNRFVMNKLNVMVNPQRKFLVTTNGEYE
jgi:RimK family alpha-L-glutamate ligase